MYHIKAQSQCADIYRVTEAAMSVRRMRVAGGTCTVRDPSAGCGELLGNVGTHTVPE